MNRFKRKAIALLTAKMIILSGLAMPAAVFADEGLDTPSGLVLNRGHIEELSFGGPIGLSWGEIDERETFTVFAFQDSGGNDPDEAYAYVAGIASPYFDINAGAAFSPGLSGGPFWFRVQAVSDDFVSDLSAPAGPFWYGLEHSNEFAEDPEGSFAIFDDPEIPVIVLDSRRPYERENQGNIIGDTHVPWPNAAAVEEGVTHADFQNAVLAAWESFVNDSLTDAQRDNLDPELGYRDIRIFVY